MYNESYCSICLSHILHEWIILWISVKMEFFWTWILVELQFQTDVELCNLTYSHKRDFNLGKMFKTIFFSNSINENNKLTYDFEFLCNKSWWNLLCPNFRPGRKYQIKSYDLKCMSEKKESKHQLKSNVTRTCNLWLASFYKHKCLRHHSWDIFV